MKVLIIDLTNSFEHELENIENTFRKSTGPIQFDSLNYKEDSEYHKSYLGINEIGIKELEGLSEQIRARHSLFKEDYLVLLTDLPLESPNQHFTTPKDWYSFYGIRSVVVKTTGWEEVTEDRSYLGVAHQIIENLFQSIGLIDLTDIRLIDNIHLEDEICINDFCETPKQTKGKIRSGYICKSCFERATNLYNKDEIIQIKSILRKISDLIADNYDFLVTDQDLKVELTSKFELRIGGREIDWGKNKVYPLYLFYLINYNLTIGEDDFNGNGKYANSIEKLTDLLIRKKLGTNKIRFEGTAMYERLKLDNVIDAKSLALNISSYQKRLRDKLMSVASNEAAVSRYLIKSINRTNNYSITADPEYISIDQELLRYRLE
jgi:hypothetical protein